MVRVPLTAVTDVVLKPLVSSKLPANEFDPTVVVWRMRPLVERLPVAWMPRPVLSEPPNVFEAVRLI